LVGAAVMITENLLVNIPSWIKVMLWCTKIRDKNKDDDNRFINISGTGSSESSWRKAISEC